MNENVFTVLVRTPYWPLSGMATSVDIDGRPRDIINEKLTGSYNQDIEIEIVRIRSIVACPVAVFSEICLQNTLWLLFLSDGAHFAVLFRTCVL